MKNAILYPAGAVLVIKGVKFALFYNFIANNPPPKDSEFKPAEMPEHTDIQIEGGKHLLKTIYHSFGMVWWRVKRDVANERMRKHTRFFEHETEVTQFKRELDED